MHILYEIEHLSTSGGIERMLAAKANYLAEQLGWEVTIVVLLEEHDASPYYPLSEKIRLEHLHVQKGGLKMCLQALWRLNKTVKRLRPDLCVTVQTIGALSTLLRTHRIPTIYEAHGIRTCMQHPLAMSVAERFAHTVVVLSEGNAQRYAKARRVVKIANFSQLGDTETALPDYQAKHCLAVGRLDFEKNYTRMISLWREVARLHPDWTLDIYGDGPEREMLQQQIDRESLQAHVILHGNSRQMSATYRTGSLLLLTSLYEGLPLVLIEAAQCGLPAIAFDCPDGPREIIIDRQTGLLIPYDDDQAMISSLDRLMGDAALRASMGQAAQQSSHRFDRQAIMAQWEKLFTDIVKQ